MNPKLQQLRGAMQQAGADAYIIFNTDPHASEYVPDDYLTAKQLSGFSGDNATIVVTQNFAGLWTDSRYYISGIKELKDSDFQLIKSSEPPFTAWLKNNLKKGAVVAFDGKCTTTAAYFDIEKKLSPAGIILNEKLDLTASFWPNRPKPKTSEIFILKEPFAGQSSSEKIKHLIEKIKEEKADIMLVTDLFEIAWLLNMRASDISYCPVFKAFAIVKQDGSIILFANQERFNNTQTQYLENLGVTICAYNLVYSALAHLTDGLSIMVDINSANAELYLSVNKQCKIIERRSPIQMMKAIKSNNELANIRRTMITDGVALERFFFWLENSLQQGNTITESEAAAKLLSLRAQGENFISESFECISAFGANAAMPHYAPGLNSTTIIERNGVYLVDSGGQYLTGTTDITRVIPTGNYTKEFSIDYTLVLKAMINIALAIFPTKTFGAAIDAIGRTNLWQHGKDFGHGTGHGVGYCLNVHESPVSISPNASKVPLAPGMVTSNEPGIYIEGKYGIRIENLLAVEKSQYEGFNRFETLTLCHIDTRAVDINLLGSTETDFLNRYNQRVFETLSPYLSGNEIDYLKNRTAKI